jgi:hypothetical protein
MYVYSLQINRGFLIRIYGNIILAVVLNGCETWFSIPRKAHENRVLRRIFGPKRGEATSVTQAKGC